MGLVAGGYGIPDPVVAHDVGERVIALFGRQQVPRSRAQRLHAIPQHAPVQLRCSPHQPLHSCAEGALQFKKGGVRTDVEFDRTLSHLKRVAVGGPVETDDQVGVDGILLDLERREGITLARLLRQKEGPQPVDIGGAAALIDDREFGFAADRARALQLRGKVCGEAVGQSFVCPVQ